MTPAFRRIAAMVLAILSTPAAAAPLTMAEAIAYPSPVVSDLGWADDARLTGGLTDEPHRPSRKVSWSVLDGRMIETPDQANAAVSPDGRHVIHLSGRQWMLRDLRTGKDTSVGEAADVTPTIVRAPTWSRDGRHVAIIDMLERPPMALPPAPPSGPVKVVDVGAALDASALSIDARDVRVILADVAQPGAARILPAPEPIIYSGTWGAGADFYFVGMEGPWDGRKSHWTLRRVDAQTGRIDALISRGGMAQQASPAVSPDGLQILLNVDMDNAGWDDFVSLAVFDIKTRTLRRLTTDLYVSQAIWSADGREAYVIARAGGLDQIKAVDMHGDVRAVTHDQRRYSGIALSPNGRQLAVQARDGEGRLDLRVLNLPSGSERVISVLADPRADGVRLAAFQPVSWKADDGLVIRGFLFLPPGFDPSRKWPLYVDVHGGGPAAPLHLSSLYTWRSHTPLEWHAIANLGYVVFAPDMRSSGEYGPTVATARYAAGDWDITGIVKDAEDVEAGVRMLLDRGYIDPSRIVLFGHSAGGGRVNYLLTRSKLFAAGIIHDPIGAGGLAFNLDMITGHATGRRLMGSLYRQSIAENPQAYTGGFLFDGYKSTTPTLLMIGDEAKGATDPLSSEVLFSVLRTMGTPTRLLRYPDEGHGPASDASALHRFGQAKAWMDRYAPGGPRD